MFFSQGQDVFELDSVCLAVVIKNIFEFLHCLPARLFINRNNFGFSYMLKLLRFGLNLKSMIGEYAELEIITAIKLKTHQSKI